MDLVAVPKDLALNEMVKVSALQVLTLTISGNEMANRESVTGSGSNEVGGLGAAGSTSTVLYRECPRADGNQAKRVSTGMLP